jgi:hypothetical protein
LGSGVRGGGHLEMSPHLSARECYRLRQHACLPKT